MVAPITEVQTGLRPYQGAPGFRFVQHLFPGLRQGGISYYPFSSIQSGLTPSWTLAAANGVAAPGAITVAIAPGSCLLDGQPSSLTSSVNVTFTPEDVVNGKNYFRLFMNPTRVMQPITPSGGVYTPPTTRLNGDPVGEGDRYLECVDFPDHLEGRAFYELKQGVWTQVDPSFAKPNVPVNRGQKRVWGNEVHSKLTGTNISINSIEAPIYLATNYPIFGYAPARSNSRQPASLELATVGVHYYVLPYYFTGTASGASLTVAHEDRAGVFDLLASVAAVNTLQVEGEAISSFNAGAGTITLADAPSGGDGTRQLMIVPVTPANVIIRSPGRSELVASQNFTNP